MIFLSLRSTFYSRPIFYFLKKEENILSNEKIINSRQQQKHDIEANWLKAVNFVPKPGELIIYDAETIAPTADEAAILGRNYAIPYARIKIGNTQGSTINNLPFEMSNFIFWPADNLMQPPSYNKKCFPSSS